MAGYNPSGARKVYRPSEARQQKGQTAPQEPNLVPIMNLFVSIIPFLIMMISISQVALIALSFTSDGGGGGTGEGGGGGAQAEIVEIHLMLKELTQAELFPGMEVREPDKTTIHKIPWLSEDVYDFDRLNSLLIDLKEKYTDTAEIAVIVHPDVLYDTLIRTIDLCKDNGFVTVHYRNPKTQYIY
ncbi:MAG: hypothetical protein WCY87_07250 [Candidatus Cloacimonadales bacterium]|jgi:hypothetical protein|nr:hypothetical protein [Candidatus Cloacimonadota bacterium]MDY0381403.1 hypothetical protein [Candidatus Cloacimonadaceae bacterium]MCB5277791.1 hypothetical protein [Candidatus Cloacimonadota bacterium]MDD2616053.1 hypothetical protein [Candidatus Cloacimonadota bacterium]MDD2718923.1 hypothetical protein [Candidatus Cloacimonadota bacterium]